MVRFQLGFSESITNPKSGKFGNVCLRHQVKMMADYNFKGCEFLSLLIIRFHLESR